MSDYTPEQNRAIQTRGYDLLVAAAAGSGKTAVLVERIILMITNTEKPVDIDRLLVVTFTEQAAFEMRRRVEMRLDELLDEKPNDENLLRQSILIHKSGITTIHSFCMSIVRSFFYAIDLDPAFRIGEEAELTLLKHEVLETLLEQEYAAEGNTQFLQLVERYSGRYKDDSFRELLLRLHSFMMTSPWPEKRMMQHTSLFDLGEDATLDNTEWAQPMRKSLITELSGLIFDFEYARSLCLCENGPLKYLSILDDDINQIRYLIEKAENSFEQLYSAISDIKFARLAIYRKNEEVDESLKAQVQELRDKAKKNVQELKNKLFCKPPCLMIEDIRNMYPSLVTLSELVIRFNRMYCEEKRDRNILDFNDLEQYCLQILLEDGSTVKDLKPTAIALELRGNYDEVLMDEYQDCNLIQELILSAVAGETGRRFMVGDIKQSIYKFRQARPELFTEKYNEFSDETDALQQKIDLFKNFRSRREVLSGINSVFRQLMSRSLGDIEYNERAALYYGANYPDLEKNAGKAVEFHVMDASNEDERESGEEEQEAIEDFSKVELEADMIARRILELVKSENPLFVRDGQTDTCRPACFSDIVILAGSVKNIGETFTEKFKMYDIPLYVNTSGGYFEALEVLTVISLLHIIDNPRQDIHVATVLHSPIYGLSGDELMRIKGDGGKRPLYDCALQYSRDGDDQELRERLLDFVDDLSRWERLSKNVPISDLLWMLYEETNYFNYAAVMPAGNVRQANLRALIEKAVQFETTSLKGLFHFIKYVEKLQKSKADLPEAKILSQSEDVVRMMTIHASKGLEFPVVFVSMLGKQFNLAEIRSNMILHADYGFGPDYIDLENRVRSNTLPKMALARLSRIESLSEAMRVLYVAMTRAKEKLILTGTVNDFDKASSAWRRFDSWKDELLPVYYMAQAKSFLDWVGPAVFRGYGEYGESLFEIFTHRYDEAISVREEKTRVADGLRQALEELSPECDYSGRKQEIEAALNWQYHYILEQTLPSKVSISEIKRNYYLESLGESARLQVLEESPVFMMPEFLQPIKGITATERGTAIHTVIEHLELHVHNTIEKIEKLIENLVQMNLLIGELALTIPTDKILNFVNSNLADRIRNAEYVKREAPFVLGLSPYEIYMENSYKESKETVLVHGIVDCYFKENGQIILVDYKSDQLGNGGTDSIREKYKVQLNIYRHAVEQAVGEPVFQTLLYLFALDDYIEM